MKLTIYFNEKSQFWVGVIEAEEPGKLRACQYVFGREPKDAEIIEFVHYHMMPLLEGTTQTVATKGNLERKINPKRLARLAAAELQRRGGSTYAQQAVQLELDHRKLERKLNKRAANEELKEKQYQLKILKAKLKHQGK